MRLSGYIVFVAATLTICAARAAEDVDWRDCVQEQDRELQASGCTRVLARGEAESQKNRSIAHNNRGNAYSVQGQKDRAIAEYDESTRLDPNYAIAYRNRGLAYYDKGDKNQALVEYDSAIRIDPKYVNAYISRAYAYDNMRQKDRAIADLDQALRLDPKNAMAFRNRGGVYLDKGENDRAIADLDQAIRIDPKDAYAYNNRGRAYDAKGDKNRAIADYDVAIRLDPKYSWPYNNRGTAYTSKGEHDRALADFDQAIRLDPRNASAYRNRGLAYFAKGDKDRAIADYDEALRIDPKYVYAYDNRGYTYSLKGDKERARADFKMALSLNPDDPWAKQGLAKLDGGSASPSPTPVTASCAGLGKRVALIIGNAAYPTATLRNPANDADDVARVLKEQLCFDVIEVKNATRAAFENAIGEASAKAEGADVALFYYAGHGMQFQQTNYLLPVDTRLTSEYDAVHANISAQDVISTLEARAKVTLAFLDACRDNPLEEDFKQRIKTLGRAFGEDRGLAPMTVRSSETLVVFATRPNQRAADGTGRNSPFTEAFIQHIVAPGKDIELVMRDVAASVRAKTNGKQVPQRLTELEHGVTLAPGPTPAR